MTNSGYLEMGLQPVTNRFQKDAFSSAPFFPMTLTLSPWYSVLLKTPFPVEEIRPRFDFLTVYEPEDHLDELVNSVLKAVQLAPDSKIRGFSFKDRTLIRRFRDRHYTNAATIDPIQQLGLKKNYGGVETLQSVFVESNFEKFFDAIGSCKLLTVRHVTEHFYQLPLFFSFIGQVIGNDGYALIEIPDCEKGLKNGDCAILWEEHIHYFTVATFTRCLIENGFDIVLEKTWCYHLENCLCFLIKKSQTKQKTNLRLREKAQEDKELIKIFSRRLIINRKIIQQKLRAFKSTGKLVTIFGAGHLTSTFISVNEISSEIDFVIDDNPKKVVMFMPNGGIEIVSSGLLAKDANQVCLLGLNPNHHNKIRDKHSRFLDAGGQMYSIFPETENSLVA